MMQSLQDIVLSPRKPLRGKETLQAVTFDDENHFERRFEKDLEAYSRKEEPAESKLKEPDEDREYLSEPAESAEKKIDDRNKRKDSSALKETGQEKPGDAKAEAEKGKADTEKVKDGNDSKKAEQKGQKGADQSSKAQAKAEEGETRQVSKQEGQAKTTVKASGEALQSQAPVNLQAKGQTVQSAEINEDTAKVLTKSGPKTEAVQGKKAQQAAPLPEAALKAEPAKNGSEKVKVATSANTKAASDALKENAVLKGTEKTDKSAAANDPKNSLPKNTAVKAKGAQEAAILVKNDGKSPQKMPEMKVVVNQEKETPTLRQQHLGTEQRPAKVTTLRDTAEFSRPLPLDRQGRAGVTPETLLGKTQTAGAEVKIEGGGASTADGSSDQQKDFKFSLSNSSRAEQSVPVKKEVVQKLVKLVRQQQLNKGQQSEVWQRHRFVMDDGKTILVAAKSAESMLTLQLGAQNQDLNKMLQQHLQEIRAHLQEQFGMQIDVQLQNSGQDGDSEFENGSQRSAAPVSDINGEQVNNLTTNIRRLGFNTNEWIA